MNEIWHFTCAHGFAGLGRKGLLRPNLHGLMPELGAVIWLTTDPTPERDDLGLTSSMLSCDRMTFRYSVRVAATCLPWAAVRDLISDEMRETAESFAKPETWLISRLPLMATLDDSWEAERAA